MRALLLRVGMVLLGKIQEAYIVASEGQRNQLGIQWSPLSMTTLLLRRTGSTGAKAHLSRIARTNRQVSKMTPQAQGRFNRRFRMLRSVTFQALTGTTREARQARDQALRLAESKHRRGLITAGRLRAIRSMINLASTRPKSPKAQREKQRQRQRCLPTCSPRPSFSATLAVC